MNYKETGLEVKLTGLEPVPIWDMPQADRLQLNPSCHSAYCGVVAVKLPLPEDFTNMSFKLNVQLSGRKNFL